MMKYFLHSVLITKSLTMLSTVPSSLHADNNQIYKNKWSPKHITKSLQSKTEPFSKQCISIYTDKVWKPNIFFDNLLHPLVRMLYLNLKETLLYLKSENQCWTC